MSTIAFREQSETDVLCFLQLAIEQPTLRALYMRVRECVRACVRARARVCVCVCAKKRNMVAYTLGRGRKKTGGTIKMT